MATTKTTEDRIIIPDEAVHLIWLEPSSGNEISITPDWLEQNGTPYDEVIDEDMTYLRTEIQGTDYNKAVLQLTYPQGDNQMTAIFLHNWNSKEDMIADFEGTYGADNLIPQQIAKYDHVDVILASYGYDNYSGDAFVLFRNKNDGKFYETHGSHCSCYGLEGQWDEEPCDIESLKYRVTEGYLGSDGYCDNVFKDEICQVIHKLEVIS